MLRVIIAGGRDFDNYKLLSSVMDEYISSARADIIIICGRARGADTLGERYAKTHKYPAGKDMEKQLVIFAIQAWQ